MGAQLQGPRFRWLVVALAVLAGLAAGAVGVHAYRAHREALMDSVREELGAIAELKLHEVLRWRGQILRQANAVAADPSLIAGCRGVLRGGGVPAEAALRQGFTRLQSLFGADSLVLLDPHGGVRLAHGGKPSVGPGGLHRVMEAASQKRPALSEVHMAEVFSDWHFDLVIPLLGGAGSPVEGVLLVRIRADASMTPALWDLPLHRGFAVKVSSMGHAEAGVPGTRPTPRPFRKTRCESGYYDVDGKPLRLASHVGRTLEAVDALGRGVVLAVRPVPGTDWILVVQGEIQPLLKSRMGGVITSIWLGGLLLVLLALLVVLAWRQVRGRHYRHLIEAELRQNRVEERLNWVNRTVEQGRAVILVARAKEGLPIEHVTANVSEHVPLTAEEILQRRVKGLDLICPEDVPHVMAKIEEVGRTGASQGHVEYRVRNRDGRVRWMSNHFAVERDGQGRPLRYHCMILNDTERKLAEETARAEINLRLAIERSLQAGVASVGLDGRQLFVNSAFAQMVGWPAEELVGASPPFKYWPPEEIPKIREILSRVIRGQASPEGEEVRFMRRDGSRFDVNLMISPLLDPHAEKIGWLAVFTDITERKKAAAAVVESERLYRTLFESAGDAILILEGGRFVDCNTRALALFGCRREDLVGVTPVQFSPLRQPDGSRSEDRARQLIEESIDGVPQHFEWRHLRKDGTPIECEITLTRVRVGGRDVIQVYVRDATAQKRLEDQFLQSQKMEAVGRLAGGVAHDFNNLLMVIGGYITLLLKRPTLDAKIRTKLDQVKHATDRAAGLTRQLLVFGRKATAHPEVFAPAGILRRVEDMAQRTAGEKVRVRIQVEAEEARILADAAQVEQALLNLILNARDAMPDGGELVLRLGIIEVAKPLDASWPGVGPGRYALLAVDDNGCGMSPEVQKHLFEPFFSTKPASVGTGLGLPTVYAVAKRWGGHVAIQSEAGRGTTVSLLFPLAEGKVENPVSVRKPRKEGVPGGDEEILLVEDEPQVRALVRSLLGAAGYRVEVSASAEEALRLVEERRRPFDLVLSDVVMPGMNGDEMVEHLRARHPATKTILMTGYADRLVGRHAKGEPKMRVLAKPVREEDLLHAVRATLDG